jgi:hypothetical protein
MVDEDEEGTVLVSGLLTQQTTLTLRLTKASEPGNQMEAYCGVCIKGCCDDDEAPNAKGGWVLSSNGISWTSLEKNLNHHATFYEAGTEVKLIYTPSIKATEGSSGKTITVNKMECWVNGEVSAPVIGIDDKGKGVCFCVGKDGGEYSWQIVE